MDAFAAPGAHRGGMPSAPGQVPGRSPATAVSPDSAWLALARAGCAAASEAAALLLPVACPGCGAFDVVVCSSCLAPFARGAQRVEAGAPRLDRLDGTPALPVWALTEYAGPVRQVVVAWKDHGRADLSPLLSALLGLAAQELAETVAATLEAHGDDQRRVDVVVVPMPSSAANQRRRGRKPVPELARSVVDGLERGRVRSRMGDILMQRRGVRDQVGLSGRQRGRNLERALTLKRGIELPANAVFLLVDDILTTGATLAAAERVLDRTGRVTLGALALAATRAPQVGTLVLPDTPESI